MKNVRQVFAPIIAAVLLAVPTAQAADPYQINTILSLTGNIAFVGSTQMQALKALESQVNATGASADAPSRSFFRTISRARKRLCSSPTT